MKIIIFLVISIVIFAETPKPAPIIDPAIQAEFWRVQVQFLVAKEALKKQEEAIKAVGEKVFAACGKDHVATDDGGLKCVPKETPKK